MYKAINIKWETDGHKVDLPGEVNIPERFIDKDGVNEESVSDWLSYTFEYVHDGFEIVEEICDDLTDERRNKMTYRLIDILEIIDVKQVVRIYLRRNEWVEMCGPEVLKILNDELLCRNVSMIASDENVLKILMDKSEEE